MLYLNWQSLMSGPQASLLRMADVLQIFCDVSSNCTRLFSSFIDYFKIYWWYTVALGFIIRQEYQESNKHVELKVEQ